MFSIVATETSVLTFVSVPGLAYRGNWFFLQLAFGYIVGRILVSIFLLPLYFKGDISSIYEVIGNRFGSLVQKFASSMFLITRLFADGVRFLATAVVVQVVTGWPIWCAVLIIGIVTMIYTLWGGMRTVLWVDSFQFILYLAGGAMVIFFILNSNQFSGWESLIEAGKIQIFQFHTENLFKDTWFFGSAFFGGVLLSCASHGADYMMVQRVLTCGNLSSARWAMIGSGIFVFIQFSVFLCAESLIWIYLDGIQLVKDREFASFIVNHLPIGIKGILLASVLSAAMSTLSSSINSLASSTIHDWMSKKASLFNSILISAIWAVLLIFIALVFDDGDTSVVVLGLTIASYTYGGLLSLFILSRSSNRFSSPTLIIGLLSSLGIVFVLQSMDISWTWFVGIAVLVNLIIVYGLHFMGFIKGIIFLLIIVLFYFFSTINNGYQHGLDSWYESGFKEIKDKNIGLVVNHTSLNKEDKHLIELAFSEKINITAIFTPEHGFSGMTEPGMKVIDGRDPLTGVPIYSLYGKTKKPTFDMMKGLDGLVVDLQDIGVRYYTYISTLTLFMEAAAEEGIPIWVLDRLNPLGMDINGSILDPYFSSFVGMHPIPIQHGMTIGELARMINGEGWLSNGLQSNLVVIPYDGDPRQEDIDAAFSPSPSPNMPDLETAWNYTGLCLIEGTNISEGRGTDSPFKILGAPWLDNKKLLESLLPLLHENDLIDTVSFIPRSLPGISSYPKYKDELCFGIKIQKLEDPIKWIINLLKEIASIHPDKFSFLDSNFIDKLYGSDQLRFVINSDNKDVETMILEFEKNINNYKDMSKKYRLYHK